MFRLSLLCLLVACRAPSVPLLEHLEVRKLAGGMGFTEGPVWLASEGALVFSDIPNSALMRWSESGGLQPYAQRANPNGNALDPDGRLLTCQHGARNIVRVEEDGSLRELVSRFEGKRLNSPNDMAVQRDGTIWFTDPPWGLKRLVEGKELSGHWVYRWAPETGELRCVLRQVVMPNGIGLSEDERILYVADTGGNRQLPEELRSNPANVSAWPILASGELGPEPLWRIDARCDGMCFDEHGNLYTTGAAVEVWSPTGARIGTIPVPERPANVCFGGPDMRTLFITARTSLYAVRLNVRGRVLPGAEPE